MKKIEDCESFFKGDIGIIQKRNLTYFEKMCKFISIPYILFAIFLVTIAWIAVLLFIPSQRNANIDLLINNWKFTWILTSIWQIIFIQILKNTSLKIFLDSGMDYPKDFTNKSKYYLNLIFFQYRLKNRQVKKRELFFRNILFISIFLSLALGLITFTGVFIGGGVSLAENIIDNIFRVSILWFLDIITSIYIIGVMYILYNLYIAYKKELNNNIKTVINIRKMEELKKIPLLLLYGYIGYMITIPTMVTVSGDLDLWRYVYLPTMILGFIGFLITFSIPSYFVYKILKMGKDRVQRDIINHIDKIEKKISEEKINQDDLIMFDFHTKRLETLEKINAFPTDFTSVRNIVLSAMIGNIYYFFTIFEIYIF